MVGSTSVGVPIYRWRPRLPRQFRRGGVKNFPIRRWWRFLAPVCLSLLLLIGWVLLTSRGSIDPFFLPTPGAVAKSLWQGWADGTYLSFTWVTIKEALLGCLFGALVGMPLAYVLFKCWWVEAAVHPFLGATQAIPAVALAPLLVLWIGYGLAPVVVLCAIMVFFPIVISTLLGLRHISDDVLDAARLDGASGWKMAWYIEFPLVLPSVLAGLRNGFTLSITGAIVGEMVMGGQGLGQILTIQRNAVDTARLFATIAVLIILASTIWALLFAVEKRSSTVIALQNTR